MKTHILFILFICLSACTTKKETTAKNDLKALNLKGEIKSVVVKNYLADEKNGQFVKGPKASQLFKTFNKNGNLLKSIGSYSNEVERRYSNDGLLTEEINYWNQKIVRHYYFTYDGQQRETQVLIYGQSGVLEQKRISLYNDQKAFVETKILDGEDRLLSRSISSKDDLGREVKKEFFNAQNQGEGVFIYMYDEDGRKILDHSIGKDEKENSLQRFVYNDDGNTIQNTIKTWYEDTIIEYSYVKFDAYGNWIVRHSKEKREKGNEPMLIPRSYEEREIAYY